MLIYHYHGQTGVFLGSGEAAPDPLELQLAREAVYAPLVAQAEGHLQATVAAAIEAFNEATSISGLTVDQLAEAEAVRDLALEAAGAVYNAAVLNATVAASAIGPVHWLIPANATTEPPPAFRFDEVAVWADGHWTISPAGEGEDPDGPEEPVDLVALAAEVRADRARRIIRVRWLIDRHRDEQALGITTTLTSEDYLTVLQHIQDLRDVPEQPGFPTNVAWPVLAPEILATGD